MRFRCYLLFALFVPTGIIVGSSRAVEADTHGPDLAPFPYAELAALAAAEVPRRIVALEHVVVRLRPAHGWSGIAEMEAGDVATTDAVTVAYTPWAWNNNWHQGILQIWLRIVLADGATGWIPAERTALSPGLWARLKTESYEPLMARWAGVGSSDLAGLRAWPDGPPVSHQSSISAGPYGVFGRSLDGEWVALRIPESDTTMAWAPVVEVEMVDRDVNAADLPVFVGTETTVLPVGGPDGRQPRSIQPGTEWRWTSDHRIIGVGEDTFWRFDPDTQAEHSVPRPTGRYELSPDRRRLAVEIKPPDFLTDERFNDVALVDLNTGAVTEFVDVHYVYSLDFGSWIGDWSPDSRAFLSPRWGLSGLEFSVLTVTGERYDLPRHYGWAWQSNNRLVHQGWEVTAVVNRDGSNLEEAARLFLSAAERYDWWAVAQQICELPPGVYPASGIGPAAFDVPDGVVGAERERIRSCAWFESWEVDRDRTILYHVPTGMLLLFHASSGQTTELIPELPPEDQIRQRGTVHLSPSGQRIIFHRGRIPVGLGMPHLFELSLQQHTELPLAYGQVCGRHWNWSPDEDRYTAEVNLTNDYNSTFGSDGLAVDARSPRRYFRVSQIRILDRTGQLIQTFRTFHADRSVIEAKWSHDGRWLAFGGHRAPECTLGH